MPYPPPDASISLLPIPSSSNPPRRRTPDPLHDSPDHLSDTISSPVYLSALSSRQPSRIPSPLHLRPPSTEPSPSISKDEEESLGGGISPSDLEFDAWGDDDNGEEEDEEGMPSDLRPPFHRPTDGKSHTPLLGSKDENDDTPTRPVLGSRKSTLHERDPDLEAKAALRKRYTYAAFFLLLSLISFTVQTETAVYIQHNLHWNKAYAMLYFTHGSWSMLWFLQLAILRLQKWNMPWKTFWRRHLQILRQTALMVQHQDISAPHMYGQQSPWPFIFRTVAIVTSALTVAGGSWYVAVDKTTASDLTAIYNCSAFFAYAFSIPMLKEKVRWSKVIAVAIAIVGVLVVAYGDAKPAKHGSKSGGGAGGSDSPDNDFEAPNRTLGNLIIGIGSVLYGFYEVLYKKMACPPDGTSPGRSMIFANFWGTCMGFFTLLVLWIPIPILHYTGLETFELPHGETAWMLLISVFANAVFSGSFLVLISLTSPVLSSVAALLTIFLVALVDQLLPAPLKVDLSGAAVAGGCLIIGAFLVLSWATYKEMEEERRKKSEEDIDDTDAEVEF